MNSTYNPVALIVLDGWGFTENKRGNAPAMADIPTYRRLLEDYPNTLLRASGEDVGLLPGQIGDSNVGHLNLGAGRIVFQDLVRISKDVETGRFKDNQVLRQAMIDARRSGKRLHIMGLLSDGGVHSHISHTFALLEMAAELGPEKVFLHCFLDGRDVPPTSGRGYIEELEDKIGKIGAGRIATVMGRYYAMDRDKRWDRTEKAYRAMVAGEGYRVSLAEAAVAMAYDRGETDEFVEPTVVVEDGKPFGMISPGDTVIFQNFRADRARQISRALTEKDFKEFDRPGGFLGVRMVGMTQYDETLDIPYAYPPIFPQNTIGEVFSSLALKQLRIAETEKYAHVTFFFSGRREEPFPGEVRKLIPSPKVATYDLKPQMSADEVASEAVKEIRTGQYGLVVLNFANPDMVGHTGIMEAALKAVEAVDRNLALVLDALRQQGFKTLVVADHGNVEEMTEEDGSPHTAHTANPVRLIMVDDSRRRVRLSGGGNLADVAPTLLAMAGIDKPPEMTGQNLIIEE